MKYLLFICVDPEGEPEDPNNDIEKWFEFAEPNWREGDRLRPVSETTIVRRRGGEVIVTDGPYAESKEFIAGFDIIEVDSREQAIEIASRHPMAQAGRVEVREFWPFEG